LGFSVEYSAEAVLQLERLDKSIARRIIKKSDVALANPHLSFTKLTGRQEYKLRVGDYRIIADVDDYKRVILIRSLGHRKNVYRKI